MFEWEDMIYNGLVNKSIVYTLEIFQSLSEYYGTEEPHHTD